MQSSRSSRSCFYFARHGEQDWDGDYKKGPVDSGLSELGQAQSQEAGDLLGDIFGEKEVLIVTSSLKRTVETAQIISSHLTNVSTIQEDDLQEFFYGDFRILNPVTGLPNDAEDKDAFKDRVLRIFIKS